MRKLSIAFRFGVLLAVIATVLLSRVCEGAAGKAREMRPFLMGFTPFPPDISLEAVAATNDFIRKHGDIVSHHFDAGVPWTEALEDKPFHPNLQKQWDGRKRDFEGKKILLSLTPLDSGRKGMALHRGKDENMPLPPEFRNKSLNDPIVKQAYLTYCRRAVEHFQPDYMVVGIEVNELLQHSPKKWPDFLELYDHVYSNLKKEHPKLPVFASVTLHNMTNPSWNRKQQKEEVGKFLERNEIVGISYYPFMSGSAKQSEKPIEVFDWLRELSDKPIAFTETGYPAETIELETFKLTIPSDPQKQASYYETLLDRATRDRYLFVISFLHRDYDALWEKIKKSAPEAFKVWRDCGLLDQDGKERPAYETWKRYFSRPHVGP